MTLPKLGKDGRRNGERDGNDPHADERAKKK